ncbi:MAG: aminodeoxychorismate lyase [Pseudohongiella sp.]|uniref:aminodeoxychorismate lyase n=1 Tax=Pseudohongiella sp. TaxID=1979412 RepID=UPI0034A04614
MAGLTLVDGVLADTLPVSDRGLLYGDGVFETIRYRCHQLDLLPAHLARLRQSCERLGIPVLMPDIERHISKLLEYQASRSGAGSAGSNGADGADGIVKIIVTRGDGGRGYTPPASMVPRTLVQFHPLPPHYEQYYRSGISGMICSHPVSGNPALAGLKHLNRLDQVMASRELLAAQGGAGKADPMLQEGLMLDCMGNLVEGTRSNVFVVLHGQLCTPDLTDAGVCGIMRSALLAWYREQGIDVAVRQISSDELSLASELFICNSVLGVWPVNRVYDFAHDSVLNLPEQAMARRAQDWLAGQ